MKKNIFIICWVILLTLLVSCTKNSDKIVYFNAIDRITDAEFKVKVDFSNEGKAILKYAKNKYELLQYPTGSGYGYNDGKVDLRGKGNVAILSFIDGRVFNMFQRLTKDNKRFFDLAVNSKKELIISTSGFSNSKDKFVHDVLGEHIDRVYLEDIDKDGNEELYVFTNSVGSGSYGSVIAYTSNNGKSVSEIHFPDIMEDKDLSQGYMGHDYFYIEDGFLMREFPIYKDEDSNAKPSGGTRVIKYQIKLGEDSWAFEVCRQL